MAVCTRHPVPLARGVATDFSGDETLFRRLLMYAVHRTLLGHEGGVLCVNVSNNGAYCMSGGQDRKIMLWNVDSGKRVTVFDGHGQSVRDLQVRGNEVTSTCAAH